jgi:penicillin-binding protein 2
MDVNANRRPVFQYAFIAVIVVYLLRIFYLQVIDKNYKVMADANALRKLTIYPSRGLIYDRNNTLVVLSLIHI